MLAPISPPRAHPRPAWAGLLERFYAPTGLPLPRFYPLEPAQVPEPYKGLLVHNSDMTSALERFYQQELGLSALCRERFGPTYFREVILVLTDHARPVEFGVIRIRLDNLPADAVKRVLEEQRPLGSILRTESVPQVCAPQAFFRVRSDTRTGAVLQLSQPCDLYGRHNVLRTPSGELIAEVVEILAPAEDGGTNHG